MVITARFPFLAQQGGRRYQADMCPLGLSRTFSPRIHSSTPNHGGSCIQSATYPMPRHLPYVPWSPLVRHRGKRTWPNWPGRPDQGCSIQQPQFFSPIVRSRIDHRCLGRRVRGVPPGSNADPTDAKHTFRSCPCPPSHRQAFGPWWESSMPSRLACHIGLAPSPP